MKKDSLLLGMCFSLLTQVRAYLIREQDVEGLELIEAQYQDIESSLKAINEGHHE